MNSSVRERGAAVGGGSIVVLCVTCRRYADRQAACRDTWVRRLRHEAGIDTVFVIGEPGLSVPSRFDAETSTLTLAVPDDYASLSRKTRGALRWALRSTTADYVFKCDDDTYVNEAVFGRLDLGGRPYVGVPRSFEQDPSLRYASGGAGYFLSRAAMALVAADARVEDELFEDVAVGRALARRGVGVCDIREVGGADLFRYHKHDGRYEFEGLVLPSSKVVQDRPTYHLQRMSAEAMRACDRFAHREAPPPPRPAMPWFDVDLLGDVPTSLRRWVRHGVGETMPVASTIGVEVAMTGSDRYRLEAAGHEAGDLSEDELARRTVRLLRDLTVDQARRRGYGLIGGFILDTPTRDRWVLLAGAGTDVTRVAVQLRAAGCTWQSGVGLIHRDAAGVGLPGRVRVDAAQLGRLESGLRETALADGPDHAVELRVPGAGDDHEPAGPRPIAGFVHLDAGASRGLVRQLEYAEALAVLDAAEQVATEPGAASSQVRRLIRLAAEVPVVAVSRLATAAELAGPLGLSVDRPVSEYDTASETALP